MAEPWSPANDLEVGLCAAVERGDVEAYLQILRTATVIVPTSDPRPEVGWLVKMVDGLPHTAVFTSSEARLTDPAARNMQELTMTLAELSKVWPDPGRRLAVNPGLSIGVYVPGSYLLSTGTRLGAVDPLTALRLPDLALDGFQDIRTGTFVAENRAEQEMLAALVGGDPGQALRAVLDATLFMISTEKDGYTAPGQAGFRWLTLGSKERGSAVPVFTARSRVDQGLGVNTYTKIPIRLLDLADAWPNDELALVVNPSCSLTMQLPGPGVLGLADLAEKLGIRRQDGDFQPGAEPEQAVFDAAAVALTLNTVPGAPGDPPTKEEVPLAAAAGDGDRGAFLRSLLGMTMRLSSAREEDPGIRFGGHRFPWQTSEQGGRTVVGAFTSPQRQRQATGASSRSSAEMANLLRYWPDPSWDLVINPGASLSATLPGSQIASLSAWYDQWVAHRLFHEFPVGQRLDMQLLDAARRGDRAGFLEILRPATVWVGTTERGTYHRVAPSDPGFPWHPVLLRGRSSLLVFSETGWANEVRGSGSNAMAKFGELASAWPAGGPDLVLNPASPISITLTADEIRAFAAG